MLDQTDMRILEELSKNSRITMKELGDRVHLTGQAVASRVAKLEDNEVIESYTVKVNQVKIGCQIYAFLNISMNEIHHKPYILFIETQENYVINNYKISGDGCYLLECRFPTNEALDQFLLELNKHANYKLSIVISALR